MKIAYADPPYIGQAKKHYDSEEVDHKVLIDKLTSYDGWALSCSSPSLKILLPICPEKTRIGAWVKPFCSFKPNVNPAYAWEPVLYIPARGNDNKTRDTVRDWVAANITLRRGLSGAKPELFCFWLFELLGMKAADEFEDLFVGTGAVTRAWEKWKSQSLLLI